MDRKAFDLGCIYRYHEKVRYMFSETVPLIFVAFSAFLRRSVANKCGSVPQFYDK